MEINVVHRVLKLNDEFAASVRARLNEHGVTSFNLISAPGSGKTALLEETIQRWDDRGRLAVIEGDPDTTLDAERIQRQGAKVTQINTEGGCHLEANLVQRALDDFDLDSVDLLFIENVGNLLCPAGFDLGERFRVGMVSVTEGADKPAKYPKLFRACDLVVLNKADLLDAAEMAAVRENVARELRPGVRMVEIAHGRLDPAVLLGLGAAAEDDLDSRPSHHEDAEDHDHDDFDSFAVELGEVASPQALAERIVPLVAAHGILRIKGFAAVAGKPMRLVLQGVGPRLQHYYDRDWRAEEPRTTRLVVIGEKGLDAAAIRAGLAG